MTRNTLKIIVVPTSVVGALMVKRMVEPYNFSLVQNLGMILIGLVVVLSFVYCLEKFFVKK